jgi:hypothetical protein
MIIDFEDAVFKLQPGEMTAVIKGKGEHYKLFKLLSMRRDREPPRSYAELRPALEQRVRIREGGKAHYAWQLDMLARNEYELDEENYATFATFLREKINTWKEYVLAAPDTLDRGWVFTGWPAELARTELARFVAGRLIVAEFLKEARQMPIVPLPLWLDSDIQLRLQIQAFAFDRMYERTLRDIQAEKVPWIEQEVARRTEDRLVDMLTALLAVREGDISDEDARAYYEANENPPMVPAKGRARRILVETEDLAWDIWERLQGGADFRALAERFSIDEQSNFRGGDTGMFEAGTLQGMADVALAHEPGDMIPPFESGAGWEIVLVLDKQPGRRATFDETKASAKRVLARERSRTAIVEHIAEMRRSAAITIDESLLERVPLGTS